MKLPGMTLVSTDRLQVWQPVAALHVLPSLILGLLATLLGSERTLPVSQFGRAGVVAGFAVLWLLAAAMFMAAGLLFRSILVSGPHTRPGAKLVGPYPLILMSAIFFGRSLILSGFEVSALAVIAGLDLRDATRNSGGLQVLVFAAIFIVALVHLMFVFRELGRHGDGR